MFVIGVVILILALIVALFSAFGIKLKNEEEEKQDSKECDYNVKE